MLVFNKVTKKYPSSAHALKDVTFEIKENEFVTLVGHSGAGKSTIFKLILGEESPTSGNILFQGEDVNLMENDDLLDYRRKIGTIFQEFRLLPYRTVYENIAFAMETIGFSDSQIRHDVPYVLNLVGLKSKIWNFPDELSGGEKQRISMARAIVNEPKILLADEPTGNLDENNTTEIINLIKQIHSLGTTVILTTHDRQVVNSVRSRTIELSEGCVISNA